jgi:endo-1,4-beta-mannosidase
MQIKNYLFFLLLLSFTQIDAQKNRIQKTQATIQVPGKVWSTEKANAWYNEHKWITGANFLPSTAINQLEMWQAATFDSATIDRELGWAQDIGFNTMRVYLHSVAWKQDPKGFKSRMNRYLNIANRHGIKTLFVFFDDCWNPIPKPGTQPEPKPGVHNSGWVQDPGQPLSNDTTLFPELERYVKDVLTEFKNDKRILLWDLYNEPGNSGKRDSSLPLLKKVFTWARAVNPDQPISVGLWAWDFEKLNAFQLQNSDVITYHNYEDQPWHQRTIELLKANGRPKHNIGAINWGFVAGKSNTIYAWDTPIPTGDQPIEWFHDIFFKDGTPYRQDEVNLIKKLNSVNK